MSDDATAPQPAPKAKKQWIGMVVVAVLVMAAVAGGTVLGSKLSGGTAAASPARPAETGDAPDPEQHNDPFALEPIVVDVKDGVGISHHLKVGIAVEVHEGIKPEQVERYVPRGRQAAIFYLRSKSFEELTDGKNFKRVAKELDERVVKAFGKKRVRRIAITDYLSQ